MIGHGPQLAPCELAAEGIPVGEMLLEGRLLGATRRLNPAIPKGAREEDRLHVELPKFDVEFADHLHRVKPELVVGAADVAVS